MALIPESDPVEFLVKRKFQHAQDIRHNQPHSLSPSSTGSVALNAPFRGEPLKHQIADYEAELRAMPREELLGLLDAALKEDRQKQADKAEEEDQTRFFNQPPADADLDHWGKAAYWTLEEAVALTFGKDPQQVNWTKIKDYPSPTDSPFVEKYRKIRELALRAKSVGHLDDPCLPSDFLGWARRNNFDVPAELIKEIEAQGNIIADWKDRHDNLQIEYNLIAEELKQLKGTGVDSLAAMQSEYWRDLAQKAEQAIKQFPAWSEGQRIVQKGGNLHYWLKDTIQANDREAEIIKKVLSDIFNELN
jgi:hypothetical protein